ncbi:DUF3016 domain-containing protein [Dokdonella koreensis]|uniref:DUF3016 domain-containing protein n=1 Tax=Dokdonella koreensis DS-123 TaxID=1300342 RepID=A0A160DT38_9GAMM|nr:DUF3016 domain-containing protein [Dokdonella koreensis]ANB17101.1 Hypothetical protein I596_1071 [Dokdonella koreensis DS-123]
MNARQRLLPLLLAAVAAATAGAALAATPAPPAGPASRIEVTWNAPDELSEVRQSIRAQRQPPQDWLETLADHLRRRADRLLPPGERLQVTITDIKLAGDFEPWHGPQYDDVRFVKEIYPPRIDLHYRLLAEDGSTLREGDSKLRDPAFLTRSAAGSSDGLRYEKRLLDDWLRREFGRQRAAASR